MAVLMTAWLTIGLTASMIGNRMEEHTAVSFKRHAER